MLAVSAGILCCLLLLLRRDDLLLHLSALLGGVPKESTFGAAGHMDLGVYLALGPTYSQGSDLSYLFKVLYCCFHYSEALTLEPGVLVGEEGNLCLYFPKALLDVGLKLRRCGFAEH